MKVEFINNLGGKMLVDESRVDEYKTAGYKLAVKAPIYIDEEKEDKPRRSIKKKN